jgi:hypothetical protein
MDTEYDDLDPLSVLLKKDESTDTDSPSSLKSLLYPELPMDYFKDKEYAFGKPSSGLKSIVERYQNAKVKPYFGVVDLNNDESSPYENKPKISYEVGVKVSF